MSEIHLKGQRIKSARSFAWNLMKKCVLYDRQRLCSKSDVGYGEMVAVFVIQTEGVDKILAETGLELSEEEKEKCLLIYSWYPMT